MFGVLVEDDEYKASQIEKLLVTKGFEINIKKAFISGIREIVSTKPDFVLLDMSIPTYEVDSEHPTSRNRKFGGRDILSEIQRIGLQTKAIVITQYSVFGDDEITLEEMDVELHETFPDLYAGIVFYNASALEWQENLLKLLME